MQKINFLLAPVVGLLTPFDLDAQKRKDDNGCVAFLSRQATPEKPKEKGEAVRKAPVRDPRLLPPMKLPPAVAKNSRSKTVEAPEPARRKTPEPAHKKPPSSRDATPGKPRRPTIFHH